MPAPQVLAQDVVNPAVIDVSLDDIGGLDNIKSTLVRARAAGPAPRCCTRAAVGRVTGGAARRAVQCGDRAAAAAAPVLHVPAAPGQGRAVVRAAGHGEDHAGQGARPGPRRRARWRCRGPAALCPTRCPCRRPPCAGRAPPKPGRAGGAQALARQSGACFINVRPSTLQSKWFGDTQKLVQATFTLAYKIQPCIIFIGAAPAARRALTPATTRAGAPLGRGLP